MILDQLDAFITRDCKPNTNKSKLNATNHDLNGMPPGLSFGIFAICLILGVF